MTPARLLLAGIALVFLAAPASAATFTLPSVRSLDGSGNNVTHTSWGAARTEYLRVAPVRYADGIGTVEEGPAPRRVSNRIFNDTGQSLFSEKHWWLPELSPMRRTGYWRWASLCLV